MHERAARSEWRDHLAIIEILNAYAEAIDRRRFEDLKLLFSERVEFDYGPGWEIVGRQEAIDQIANSLVHCGRTQHLLGNYRVELAGNVATSACYMRAFHVGIGAAEGQTYEMAGHCRDVFANRDGRWEMTRRVGRMMFETGSRAVLDPSEGSA